jgi:hypothetical protein
MKNKPMKQRESDIGRLSKIIFKSLGTSDLSL